MTRVLIADDSELVRTGLHELIEDHAGWVCAEAVNGRDAITKIQQQAPDILILDLRMPVMDGLQAARAITKLAPDLPILLCTTDLRLLWFPWLSVVESRARSQNMTVVRLLAGSRRYSETRPSSAGTEFAPILSFLASCRRIARPAF